MQEGKLEEVKLIVVSLSVQPVLSLAQRYNLSPDEAAQKLSGIKIIFTVTIMISIGMDDTSIFLEEQKKIVKKEETLTEKMNRSLNERHT